MHHYKCIATTQVPNSSTYEYSIKLLTNVLYITVCMIVSTVHTVMYEYTNLQKELYNQSESSITQTARESSHLVSQNLSRS